MDWKLWIVLIGGPLSFLLYLFGVDPQPRKICWILTRLGWIFWLWKLHLGLDFNNPLRMLSALIVVVLVQLLGRMGGLVIQLQSKPV